MEELNNTNETQVQDTETEETKTYTQEELDDYLQRETDRRVSAALKKQEQKNAAKVKEAERLANMSAEQRYEETLRQREAAIAAKEAELALSENKNVCAKILADKGISLDFVEFCVAEDADTMDANIKKIDKAFKASVRAEVERRLAAKSPATSMAAFNGITKDQFNKMSLMQQQELFKSEPEVYSALTNK